MVGEAALLVCDPTDAVQVSQAILAVSGDAEKRAEMVRRGLSQASRFSWRRCAEETLRVLERCSRTSDC